MLQDKADQSGIGMDLYRTGFLWDFYQDFTIALTQDLLSHSLAIRLILAIRSVDRAKSINILTFPIYVNVSITLQDKADQ